jgi:hypothetical protein
MRKQAWFAAIVTGFVVAMASPAFAHVTVNPSEAQQGDFTKLTFRVPNERDNAGTASVEVNFPTDVVIPFVSTKPSPVGRRRSIDGRSTNPSRAKTVRSPTPSRRSRGPADRSGQESSRSSTFPSVRYRATPTR